MGRLVKFAAHGSPVTVRTDAERQWLPGYSALRLNHQTALLWLLTGDQTRDACAAAGQRGRMSTIILFDPRGGRSGDADTLARHTEPNESRTR